MKLLADKIAEAAVDPAPRELTPAGGGTAALAHGCGWPRRNNFHGLSLGGRARR
jgi:hypothetical protein